MWAGALHAADSGDSESRLRETLRSTMLQLRSAQADLANLQAAQAAQGDDTKALNEQIALLKKHSAEDRAASDKAISDLKAKVAAQTEELSRFKLGYESWKDAAQRAAKAAQAAEAARARDAAAAAILERKAADLQAKNEELFKIGNEILTRYEKFSLGEQFLAREPFIGRTRTELENLIQDYNDKLIAQQSKP
jgi:hypothetical protein